MNKKLENASIITNNYTKQLTSIQHYSYIRLNVPSIAQKANSRKSTPSPFLSISLNSY